MTNDENERGHRRRLHWPDTVVLICASALLAAFVMPPREPAPQLPELGGLEPQDRKEAFVRYLDPIVARVNADLRRQRAWLAALAARVERGDPTTWWNRRYLGRLVERYEVSPLVSLEETLAQLNRRIDVVPRSLVLVQAAKESGWGTSRFATEGNNLFGQRCYEPGCGLTPRRVEHARFAVAAYDSTLASVRDYARNLNTHLQYREFRALRQQLRERGEPLSGLRLADGLAEYSERGEAYVAEIKTLIRQNDLEPNEES